MACCPRPSTAQSEVELSDDSDIDIQFTRRIPKLASIESNSDHRLTLLDWTKQFDASERNLERKLANSSSSKSDLYQILGLFFVFQGVILTAVAQSSKLICSAWHWLPVLALSVIASIATTGACIQKLKEIAVCREQCALEKALYQSLYKSIEGLKEEGLDFDLEQNQPTLRGKYTKNERTGSGTCSLWYSDLSHFCRVWVISYAGAVLLLVCAFSAVTAFAVPIILCRP